MVLSNISDVKEHLNERLEESEKYRPEIVLKRRLNALLESIKETNKFLCKNPSQHEDVKKISLNLGVAYVDIEETINAFLENISKSKQTIDIMV